MGAWIEIIASSFSVRCRDVAPYMGAWIEICLRTRQQKVMDRSHPTWVRGLK